MKHYLAKLKNDFIYISSLFNSENNKYLINKGEVSTEDLMKWNESPKKYNFIISKDNKKIGWFAIDVLKDEKEAKFGMIIDCPHRGKGCGYEAMTLVEAEMKNLGVKKIKLQVFEDNKPAVRIYEKAGFRRAGIMINMEKEID